jgi:hypothetical protein
MPESFNMQLSVVPSSCGGSLAVTQPYRPMRGALRAALAVAGILAAACTSIRDRGAPAGAPAPPLQLVSAGDLALPRDCQVPDGVVYRTYFVVQVDGRVGDIRPDPAPACLQAALAQWLGSARYAPAAEAVPTAMDWISVSARRIN